MLEPFRFDQMRPGCYDIDARVRDMDLNGVWASLNFPSQITGFCGRVFFDAKDRELGLACVRAWNDWLYEDVVHAVPRAHRPVWASPTWPTRRSAVAEIRRNADRGFTVGHLARAPARDRAALAVGPGALGPDHRRPCVETDTVISLHVGSSGLHVATTGRRHGFPAARRNPVRPAVADRLR